MKKVRAGKVYMFKPVSWDIFDSKSDAVSGQPVKVVALPGCPKPNTMGHCHIQRYDPIQDQWVFSGLVLCASLQPWKIYKGL